MNPSTEAEGEAGGGEAEAGETGGSAGRDGARERSEEETGDAGAGGAGETAAAGEGAKGEAEAGAECRAIKRRPRGGITRVQTLRAIAKAEAAVATCPNSRSC